MLVPRRILPLLALLAALLAATAPAAAGCTWSPGDDEASGCGSAAASASIHASPDGDDTAGDGSASRPFRTISRALKAAGAGGATIQLAAGDYPAFLDSRVRTGPVLIHGLGRSTRIDGARLYGSQELRFADLTFTARVIVNHHGSLGAAQRAARLAFMGVEMTGGCVQARNVDGLVLAGSWLHDCGVGFSAPAQSSGSTDVTITGSVLERFSSDGMMLGRIDGLTIVDSVIREITAAPDSAVHNDGVQVIGDVQHMTFSNNVVTGSRHQLLFVSDDFGANDDIEIVNNLLYNAGAVAMQAGGTTGLEIRSNTIWAGAQGGLWLRRGYNLPAPPHSVVTNNILSTLRFTTGATATLAGNAVTGCSTPQPGVACLKASPFSDAAAGDFTIADQTLAAIGDAAQATSEDLRFEPRVAPSVPGALDPGIAGTPAGPSRAAAALALALKASFMRPVQVQVPTSAVPDAGEVPDGTDPVEDPAPDTGGGGEEPAPVEEEDPAPVPAEDDEAPQPLPEPEATAPATPVAATPSAPATAPAATAPARVDPVERTPHVTTPAAPAAATPAAAPVTATAAGPRALRRTGTATVARNGKTRLTFRCGAECPTGKATVFIKAGKRTVTIWLKVPASSRGRVTATLRLPKAVARVRKGLVVTLAGRTASGAAILVTA